jgi:hypothetical protein
VCASAELLLTDNEQIYPGAGMLAAALALKQAYATLKKTGTDKAIAQGQSPRDFFRIVGAPDRVRCSRRRLPLSRRSRRGSRI